MQRQGRNKCDEIGHLDAFAGSAGRRYCGGGVNRAAGGRVEGGMQGGETGTVEKIVKQRRKGKGRDGVVDGSMGEKQTACQGLGLLEVDAVHAWGGVVAWRGVELRAHL